MAMVLAVVKTGPATAIDWAGAAPGKAYRSDRSIFDPAAPATALFPTIVGTATTSERQSLFTIGANVPPPGADFLTAPRPNPERAVATAAVRDPKRIAPPPAALPLFVTGIAVLGWMARPRKGLSDAGPTTGGEGGGCRYEEAERR